MSPEQVQILLDRLDQVIFLLQAANLALAFLCGFISMQFIIHAKNQKNFF